MEIKPLIAATAFVLSSMASAGCGNAGTESAPAKEPPGDAAAGQPAAAAVIDHEVESLEGDRVDLASFRGRPMLIVNTASKCGYTRQYAGLQELHERYSDRGLVVIGFPSNDFGGQEPGSNVEIGAFCRTNYGVEFPMMAKVHTKGPEKAPVYRSLTEQTPDGIRGELRWNFTKFLVDADGEVVARFEPAVEPMSPELTSAIEKLLPQAPAEG
jgi:glutathione peroxidase